MFSLHVVQYFICCICHIIYGFNSCFVSKLINCAITQRLTITSFLLQALINLVLLNKICVLLSLTGLIYIKLYAHVTTDGTVAWNFSDDLS